MTTLLTRIMFPYLIFISLAALAMGILNSLRALRGASVLAGVLQHFHYWLRVFFIADDGRADPRCGYWGGGGRRGTICHAVARTALGAACCSGFDSHQVILACGGSAR